MVEIKLHNTKTRSKETFVPIDPDNVRMYVCGPTVYDRAHLGNARPVVVFDVLFRLLRHVYGPGHVTYVRNITDVDDKIIARAEESGREIGAITEETAQWYHDDMGALGNLDPSYTPHATAHVPQMVAMIADLVAGGHAYAAEGHVLFAVESYADYGRLSGRSVDDMIAGARVEVAPYKRNPMDFVLWKPSTEDQPGWDSPWGRGRPGWHIECSAMAHELLGTSFDIHGGGNDLMFPHHENEIAQSACAHPQGEFARYWMHNEMLQVEGRKMSKSLGNFFTVHDLLEGHDGQPPVPGEVIRFVFLGTHYRKPMDWTQKKAREAKIALNVIYQNGVEGMLDVLESDPDTLAALPSPNEAMVAALAQDLNTPEALRVFRAEAKVLNADNRSDALQIIANGRLLGFFETGWRPTNIAKKDTLAPFRKTLEQARADAQETKDFSQVDRLKAMLVDAGVEVRMSKEAVVLVPTDDFDPAKLEALK